MKEKKKNFFDEIFLNNKNSLFNIPKKPKYPLWNLITWNRIKEIFPKENSLFESNDSENFQEGQMNIDNFISAYSSLLTFPQRIKNLFENQKKSLNGIYYVKVIKSNYSISLINRKN